MSSKVISPSDIECGGFIDDTGQRYTSIRFTDAAGDEIIVTMLIPTFLEFARQVSVAADAYSTRAFWKDVPRG